MDFAITFRKIQVENGTLPLTLLAVLLKVLHSEGHWPQALLGITATPTASPTGPPHHDPPNWVLFIRLFHIRICPRKPLLLVFFFYVGSGLILIWRLFELA